MQIALLHHHKVSVDISHRFGRTGLVPVGRRAKRRGGRVQSRMSGKDGKQEFQLPRACPERRKPLSSLEPQDRTVT